MTASRDGDEAPAPGAPASEAPASEALAPEELRLLEGLLARLQGHGARLPWPLFRFINEIIPTPNVDLLVRDGAGRILLAWRDDPFGRGWHVPGSVIRHREPIAARLSACAADEFSVPLEIAERPMAIVEIFDGRGHSVSICHEARPRGEAPATIANDAVPVAGDLRWFGTMPAALYPSHRVYREVVAWAAGPRGEGVPVFTATVAPGLSEPGGSIRADTSLTEGG